MEKGEMSAPKADPGELPSEVLSRILSLAAAERAASNAGMWKMNVEAAVEIHGQAWRYYISRTQPQGVA
jgi:hypothetical protein